MTIQSKTIEYSHNGTTLEGYLAWDDARSGPRPGVLVGHAWAGRSEFENRKAEALAELGYVGFALDLYGKGVLGQNTDENAALMQPFLDDRAMLQSRLQAALTTLREQDTADAGKTAIMGYCFGGLCALDLARIGTDIAGAISVHGLFNAPGNTTDIQAKVLVLHGWDDPMAQPDTV
ncbi:MAG: dienelactone hydrolase family protein, partial [Pseudomonadota bacterium]